MVVAIAVVLYYVSVKPSPVSQQSTNTTTLAAPHTNTAVSGTQAPTTDATVTLYNSGAGAEAVSALAGTLKQAGYTSQDLGDSQFQLDQTYIWYQAAYLSDVEKIQKLLEGKKVALRPYTGTGPYKILVQLGP